MTVKEIEIIRKFYKEAEINHFNQELDYDNAETRESISILLKEIDRLEKKLQDIDEE